MSPEQLNGEAVDGRSDLFSLGVVLYTVLTGYRPFQGNSALTVSFKVVNRDPVPATALDTHLPPGLDSIISRAMAKDPGQRYQSGKEMALDIQALREGKNPPGKTGQPASDGTESGAQTTDGWAGTWAAGQRAGVAKPAASTSAQAFERKAADKLLENMRKKSFAGALLLLGLSVFGFRVGQLFWPHEVPAGKAAAAPTAADGSVVTSVVTARPRIGKKLPKAVHANGTHPPPPSAKVAVADSPTVSPASLPATPPAMLDIEVEHKFAEAHLSIWVDDTLSYVHTLEGTDKKHLVVFHHVQGHEFHAMQIAPGKHVLRVQVTSGEGRSEQFATVTGDFSSGQENMLHIGFNKQSEMYLSLQ